MVCHVHSLAATVQQQKPLHRFQTNCVQLLSDYMHHGWRVKAKSVVYDFLVSKLDCTNTDVKL